MVNQCLSATLQFHDVDGNKIQRVYRDYPDVVWLLGVISNEITGEDDFPKVVSKRFPGLNGTIDITKPLQIVIMLQ